MKQFGRMGSRSLLFGVMVPLLAIFTGVSMLTLLFRRGKAKDSDTRKTIRSAWNSIWKHVKYLYIEELLPRYRAKAERLRVIVRSVITIAEAFLCGIAIFMKRVKTPVVSTLSLMGVLSISSSIAILSVFMWIGIVDMAPRETSVCAQVQPMWPVCPPENEELATSSGSGVVLTHDGLTLLNQELVQVREYSSDDMLISYSYEEVSEMGSITYFHNLHVGMYNIATIWRNGIRIRIWINDEMEAVYVMVWDHEGWRYYSCNTKYDFANYPLCEHVSSAPELWQMWREIIEIDRRVEEWQQRQQL